MNDDKNIVQHTYRNKTDKRILKKNPWKDYGLHLSVLFLVIIAEFIGPIELSLSPGVSVFVALPLTEKLYELLEPKIGRKAIIKENGGK